jgi:N-acetylglutamate synthase-like GNAT family acetyltransferase
MNMRAIEVRDWAKLQLLLKELASEHPPVALELEPLIFKTEEWIRKFPQENQGIFIVAEENEQLEGFCYLVVPKFYQPVAYIGIAIGAPFRRHALGLQLFYHVMEWAAKKDLQYILSDVWAWNEQGKKFFTHLGFTEKEHFQSKFNGEEKEKIRFVKKV